MATAGVQVARLPAAADLLDLPRRQPDAPPHPHGGRRIGFCGGARASTTGGAATRATRGSGATPWCASKVRSSRQLQNIFIEDWVLTTGEVLNGDAQFPHDRVGRRHARPGGRGSRTDQSSMAKLLVYMAIQAARRERSGSRTPTSFRTADPAGPRARRAPRRGRARSSCPASTSTSRRPHGLAVLLRRAARRRRRRSTSTCRR